MTRHYRFVVSALLMITCIATEARADQAQGYWPTWRGPAGTGVAPLGDPPVQWSETENIKWKIELPGEGSSSPIIWGDKLFFQTAVLTEEKPAASTAADQSGPGGRGGMTKGPSGVYNFDLVCLDRNTGKILWQTTARTARPHEGAHRDHGFASYSPITDGQHIWASFGSRGLHCFDMNGNLKWSQDLTKMETRAGFGEGSSPAIAGDAVVAVTDHEGQSAIFAFNKLTGEPLWRKDRDEQTNWATPVAVEVNGKVQVITSATNLIRSYDAITGEVVWQCSGQTTNVIPTPVIGFGMVFCTSGYKGNSLQAIKLGKTGDLSGTDAIAWQVSKATPYVPSPLLYGDRIYVCSGNNGVISCYQATTGQPYYVSQKIEAIRGVYASPVAAAGRIYLAGRRGTTVVFKDSQSFEPIATNTLDDGFDASPAIVGNALYLKGNKNLYCISNP